MSEKEGWGLPGLARKWHYFRKGISLCRKWMYGGELQKDCGVGYAPSDCTICVEKLKKEKHGSN